MYYGMETAAREAMEHNAARGRDISIADRVEAGLTWGLSREAERIGFDLRRVDMSTVDMESGDQCVAGQAMGPRETGGEWDSLGGYTRLLDALTDAGTISAYERAQWGWDHGFAAFSHAAYVKLQAEWARRLAELH